MVFECEPRLVPLFRRSFPKVTVVPCTDPPDPAIDDASPDLHCPSGSLGRWLRPNLDSFAQTSAYLVADARQVEPLLNLLQDRFGQKKRIGVSWKSARAGFGVFKSSDLAADWKLVLGSVPDAVFVSLQYGNVKGVLDRANQSLGVIIHNDLGIDVSWDMDGLAALISRLDLVITTSNTTAHLAGALGVPTWVLVPRGPARLWYWFDGDPKSLWYPDVTLYWQDTPGDWSGVMTRVSQDLRSWTTRKTSEPTA